MESQIRLKNEYKNILKTLRFGCYARPRKTVKGGLNLLHWDCQFYKDGYFYKFSMKFTKNYPSKPPVVTFATKVFNPNVYSTGEVCLDLIGHNWQPSFNINDIFNGLYQLLDNPNSQSPANEKAARYFENQNKSMYEKEVKKINDKHNSKYCVQEWLNNC